MNKTRNRVYFAVMCASLLAGQTVWADAEKRGDAPTRIGSQDAEAILDAMATFLSKAQRFSMTIRTGYDAVQASGQKIEFNEERKILISRPDYFRSDIRQSDGDSGVVVFDGKAVTVFNANDNVYAKLERTGSVDDTIRYIVGELGMRVPLARLLVTTLPAELKRSVISADYVEKNTLTEVPMDHIAAQTRDVNFQVWVDAGEKPLPRRVVITYKHAAGQPQFWAELSNWNFAPEVSDELFRFTPPAGAEQIPVMTPVARTGGVR